MKIRSADIKQRGLDLGFSAVGIARAEELSKEGKRLAEWLDRRYNASMDWMASSAEKRINPLNVLPGARSVISVAVNYYTPQSHSDDLAAGKISRYAWGDDYHDVLSRRLEQLVGFIRKLDPNVEAKIYVDTGPVMDKVWAERAGVGWIGKHTNVITLDNGSWVFLGVIILNIDLEYDVPATDECGNCTLCIEACPTGAIVEPYVLDAGRCISYLTIEHRGTIDNDLAGRLDGWVYGCDVCQDVCPWNVKLQNPTTIGNFHPRSELMAPPLEVLAELSQEAFSRMFSNSPVKRTKRSGIVRNAEANLGRETRATVSAAK